MHQKKNKQTEHSPYAIGITYGIVSSIIATLLLGILLTTLISKEQIQMQMIEHFTPIIIFIATILGCVIAIKWCKDKLAIIAGSIGIIYLFILVGMGVLFFNGGFHNLWTNLLSVILGCALSCAICIRGKRSGKKRKRAYR